MAFHTLSSPKAVADPERSDPKGVGAIYRRYVDAVRGYVARHYGSGPPDPEDIVQTAFEKFSQLDAPSEIENPYAFLVRCSRNLVIDHHRRAAVRADHAREAGTSLEIDRIDAERVFSSRQRLELVAQAIAKLDDRHREMLLLNRVEGLSCAQIGAQKGCSASLVKLLVAEALVACREALGPGDEA